MRGPVRWAAVGAIALAVTAAAVFGPPRDGPELRTSAGVSLVGALAPTALLGGSGPGDRIAALQAYLRARPDDPRALASLGIAYVQQARSTADPSFYGKAEVALRRALATDPGSYDATLGLGALALARHDFAAALRLGRAAAAINPDDEDPWGVIGDALLELGRYRAASRAFQRMVDTRPGAAAYARISYARELTGDVPGAIRAMRMALDAAGTPQDAAWTATQLGDLYWNRGGLRRAARAYRQALTLLPGYPPGARRAGAGGVGAGGCAPRDPRAVRRRAPLPLPEYVVALGDLAWVSGRRRMAREQYRLARAEHRLFRGSGVNIDLELALFDADHGAPGRALAAARAEWRRRRSVHVADALSWALYRNGRPRAAARYARLALRLGTPNPLFLYHAGMIRLALGDRSGARRYLSEALGLNPWFSFLHAAEAQRALARLGGSSG